MPFPRKSIAAHRLQGTLNVTDHRERMRREVEPAAPLDADRPPEHLTEGAARLWREAVQGLPVGMLGSTDAATLAAWCGAADRHARAEAALAEHDATSGLPPGCTRDRDGAVRVHPLIRVISSAVEQLTKLGAQLGLTPQARLRLSDGLPPKDDKPTASDPWAAFEATARPPLRLVQGGAGARKARAPKAKPPAAAAKPARTRRGSTSGGGAPAPLVAAPGGER